MPAARSRTKSTARRAVSTRDLVDESLLKVRWAPAGDAEATRDGCPTLDELLQWLDDQRASQHLLVKRVDLKVLADWHMRPNGTFAHRTGRFFRVIGLAAQSPDREVPGWHQPILENPRQGIIGLLRRTINGRRYFLLQAKTDVGNRPPVQLAATVQFTPGNYVDNAQLPRPFLFTEFLKPTLGPVVYNALQSEEGARFFRECHLHRVIELAPGRTLNIPDHYRWFSLDAIRFFLHLGETVSSSARSILACQL